MSTKVRVDEPVLIQDQYYLIPGEWEIVCESPEGGKVVKGVVINNKNMEHHPKVLVELPPVSLKGNTSPWQWRFTPEEILKKMMEEEVVSVFLDNEPVSFETMAVTLKSARGLLRTARNNKGLFCVVTDNHKFELRY